MNYVLPISQLRILHIICPHQVTIYPPAIRIACGLFIWSKTTAKRGYLIYRSE